MDFIALLTAIILGVLVGGFLLLTALAILNNYLEDTPAFLLIGDAEEDDDVLMAIEPQNSGSMEYPCPTWDGACNCSPLLGCQDPQNNDFIDPSERRPVA